MSLRALGFALKWMKGAHGAFKKPGGVFVDIGSGQGKACLAAALMHPFDRVVGIELLMSLNELSLELKRRYD